ncbi:PTS sugar transporter subunit IIA [Lactococcus laudensis]|uniref:PTS sugar transporter subunit IIA n=1 Tax=Pseudolactococcus laudensis TaxID=1494461 RepID=UPI002FC65B19
MFKQNLVFSKLNIKNYGEVITLLGTRMEELGCVKQTYVSAVLEREKGFPTGLQMGEYGIAIPHTESSHVCRTELSIATLQEPVEVYSMIDPTKVIRVSLVILMAVKDPSGQVKMLSKLMGLFQNVEMLKTLETASSSDEMYEILSTIELKTV